MKNSTLPTLLMTGLVLSLAATGCRKNPDRLTAIPYNSAKTDIKDPPPTSPLPLIPPTRNFPPQPPVNPEILTNAVPLNPKRSIEDRDKDRQIWADKTIRFAFDSAAVKASEGKKIEAVAASFKAMDAAKDLLVEGHCDERGTEEYNRSLGERRALAMREYLIRLGVASDRIHTTTLGKDKPVEFGHNEAAWSKNRRGEFILVK